MIGKVTKAGKGFGGLVSYLLHGDKDKKPATRVAWSATRNLGITDPKIVAKLMAATAAKSKRVKSPVYHYVISWAPNDIPSDDLMRQVADTTCEDLRLQDHQMLFVAHDDTKHRHVHIVANRVHPETGTAWKMSHDYRRIETSLRRQAEAMGIAFVEGRHNSKTYDSSKPRRAKSSDRRGKERSGKTVLPTMSPSQVTEVSTDLGTLFSMSSSWDALAYGLRLRGYALTRKGQGLMITDGVAEMKLSSLGRDIRLKELQERFNEKYSDFAERAPNLADERVRHAPDQRPETPIHVPQPTRVPERPTSQPIPEPTHAVARPDHPQNPLQPSKIHEAYQSLTAAKNRLDLAKQFHAAGLATDKDLQNARRELEQARQDVLATQPLMDQLLDGIGSMWDSKPVDQRARPASSAKRKSRPRGRGR